MEFGMDRKSAELIRDLLREFNSYPPEVRERMLKSFLDAVRYENGKISVDWREVPDAITVLIGSIIVDSWNERKEKRAKALKDFEGAMFGRDIVIDEEAFIRAADRFDALVVKIQGIMNDVDDMLNKLQAGFDTPAGRKFCASCRANLMRPLNDQKLVIEHMSQMLRMAKSKYQSVFDAYGQLSNSISSYRG
jgi:hypothetical protein